MIFTRPRLATPLMLTLALATTLGLSGSLTPTYAAEHWKAHRDHAAAHQNHPSMMQNLFKDVHLTRAQQQVTQAILAQYQHRRQAWMKKHGKQLHQLMERAHKNHQHAAAVRRQIRKLTATCPSFKNVIAQLKLVLKKDQLRPFQRNVAHMKKAWRRRQAEHHKRHPMHSRHADHRQWHKERESHHKGAANGQIMPQNLFANLGLSHSQAHDVRAIMQKYQRQALEQIKRDVLTHRQAEQFEKNIKDLHSHHAKHRRSTASHRRHHQHRRDNNDND